MSAAWLTSPVTLTGMRMFECGDLITQECDYYKHRWHFWYIADYIFALPTVAFFMSAISIFIIGHFVSSLLLGYRKFRAPLIWQKLIAGIRYLSYRGFRVKQLEWNSAPVGVLLLGAAGTIFFFCTELAPKPYYWSDEMYGGSPPLATRSGWLALGCMPFIFATASKTNWLTLLTGVSHERLQVFHRWIAYAFFILALLHTFPFIVYHIHWHDMEKHFSDSLLFYWTGIVAIVFQAWLTFMSHSTIRSLGYEFFKLTHFTSAIVFMLTFFWHCDYTLTSWHYFIATAAIYVPCFVYPWLRIIFEYKWTQQAQIYIQDNGFTRITIPAKFHWKLGQHCFLRFTGFGVLDAISAHPFTICSTPPKGMTERAELVFYIRHRKGFTAKLYQYALDYPGVSVPVLVDGPYGGVNPPRLRDADRLLVIAGGSGAGWCLPFIEHFIRLAAGLGHEEHCVKSSAGRTAVDSPPSGPTSLRVILATRDISSRNWFRRIVEELLASFPGPRLPSSAQVQVYLTGQASHEVDSPAETSNQADSKDYLTSNMNLWGTDTHFKTAVDGRDYEGRPQLPLIIQEEAAKAAEGGELLAVYICGPDTMQNDVRNAVARENLNFLKGAKSGGVYMHSEHFSWA